MSIASRFDTRPSLPFILLLLFVSVLWLAGGASRPDVAGQPVVRASATAALIVSALFGPRPSLAQERPAAIFLLAAILLAALQLVPLPPAVWQTLPGRAFVTQAAIVTGQPQSWRPLAIVPGAAINALTSLIVPLTVLVLVAGLKERERAWLPGLLLSLIAASMIVGLVQLINGGFDNPLINDSIEQVSGTFANRNHFALFLALGCLVAPVWAFLDGRRPGWHGPAALGLVLLFVLAILAVGSRGGLLVGGLALGLGLLIVQHSLRQVLARFPRWTFPALSAALLCVVVGLVLLSVQADRAASISRVFTSDPGQDMRSRGLPTVLAMIGRYFPAGAGLGGFDPMFRINEPFDLLKLTYFNHAHNDWLEVVLDTGLTGVLLLAAAVMWWGWASVRASCAGGGVNNALPKLGSAIILLMMISSLFDYPVRTPTMMMVIVLAAVWLGQACARPALPRLTQHL